jgi:non-lysosomal glucosylceramidase
MVEPNAEWPVLTEYDADHLARIALPIGGIGTGTVSLGGRGDLRDWEIVNRPAKGFVPALGRYGAPFFCLYAQPESGPSVVRLIEGPLGAEAYEGSHGSEVRNHGLPRFRECRFAAAYPLGQVMLSDPEVPLAVRIEAFNPLIPADATRSGIPIAMLRYVLVNPGDEPVTAAVCGSVPNFIGADGWQIGRDWRGSPDNSAGPKENRNVFVAGDGWRGLAMSSAGIDPRAEQWGTLCLATTATEEVTYRTAWAELSWGDSLLDFWDDLGEDGRLSERQAGDADAPVASLAARVVVPPGGSRVLTFLLAWHFPNRRTWQPRAPPPSCCAPDEADLERVGNYYTTQYRDAQDVIEQVVPALGDLERETLTFVRAFCESDLPPAIKEAALYNVSTLRTQTCYRTEDGRLYGWEGCSDRQGCCFGSCTHVWNYEQATAFLFGELAKSMRQVEFGHATDERGLMSFRVQLPLERAEEYGHAAADGQMGCLIKLYRDWQLSGDDEMLRALWPAARRALSFCWVEGGWDADVDGVMEGCQHNTMDVEYYGPNPQMATWYLGALRAAEEMARYVGDAAFAARCRDLFRRGLRWVDDHLFNGEYYEQEIRPPEDVDAIAPGLRVGMGTGNPAEPALQLGAGCLVDQLVGQYMAHVCGLGYLLDRQHVRTTLESVMRYNFRQGFHDHFNHMRSFVLSDEAGLLMATYPRGNRPRRPFPYYTEVMTGFEYSTAAHMIYEGQEDAGLRCIEAIRDRYDGRKRSPFDEAECGHHYARAMASWAAALAWTGFHYSAVEGRMSFAPREGTWFWSTGYAWGTCTQARVGGPQPCGDGYDVTLDVRYGRLSLRTLQLGDMGTVDLGEMRTLKAGQRTTWRLGPAPRTPP